MGSADSKLPLTILHTNDFHDHLRPESARRIAEIVQQTPQPLLLVDAGDAGGSSNITFRSVGEPILDTMSELGYAAMTVGNRDFHVTRAGFRAKLCRARFPVLCANVRPTRVNEHARADDTRPLAASAMADEPDLFSYIVSTVGTWRVLLIGLTVPMVTARMWERKLSSYLFEPPIRTAASLVPALVERIKPDLTVALTHIGLRLDRDLAASVAAIDLIVGGHSHELLPEGERVGDSLIVQAGSHGRQIGIVTVAPPADLGRPKCSARIEPL